jgi:hypothetical protein
MTLFTLIVAVIVPFALGVAVSPARATLEMLVIDRSNNSILRDDGLTKDLLGTLALSEAGVSQPHALAIGLDGNFHVSSVDNKKVFREEAKP